MAKRYVVKDAYKGQVIATRKPDYRNSGIFHLASCSQRDLRFLYRVIRHPAVKEVDHAEK